MAEQRPLETAFEDTDKAKHQAVIELVKRCKDDYFNSNQWQKYIGKVKSLQFLVNQEWEKKTTRFGIMHALIRSRHDSILASLNDLFDIDDLVMFEAEEKKDNQKASDMQAFAKKVLRNCQYRDHLSDRLAYLPDYGWSVARDSYSFNEGFATKVTSAKSAVPGMENLSFERQMDVLMDRPNPEVVPVEHWFGSMEFSRDQPFQGYMKRWYLRDLVGAKERKTKDGKHLYNVAALDKLIEAMIKGTSTPDTRYQDIEDGVAKAIQWDRDKSSGPYVDVTVYFGPVNGAMDLELAKDANEYHIECTETVLLLWNENPIDRFSQFTHARTHPKRRNPTSRSYLDMIKPHQNFTDFTTNMSLESIMDNLTKHWAYWEEDLADPDQFFNPKGINAFLQMQGKGRAPELLGQSRNPAFQDVKEIMVMMDRDRQRAGATDQEAGVLGKTQDQTATAARLLAAASSKDLRSMVRNISRDAIVPQVKNLVMLALVNSKPEMRKILSGDRMVEIGKEQIEWFLTSASMKISDTITRDRETELIRWNSFIDKAIQVLPQLNTPDNMIEALRLGAEMYGFPQSKIDTMLPAPGKIDLGGPGAPGAPVPPAAPGAPALPDISQMMGGANAPVA